MSIGRPWKQFVVLLVLVLSSRGAVGNRTSSTSYVVRYPSPRTPFSVTTRCGSCDGKLVKDDGTSYDRGN